MTMHGKYNSWLMVATIVLCPGILSAGAACDPEALGIAYAESIITLHGQARALVSTDHEEVDTSWCDHSVVSRELQPLCEAKKAVALEFAAIGKAYETGCAAVGDPYPESPFFFALKTMREDLDNPDPMLRLWMLDRVYLFGGRAESIPVEYDSATRLEVESACLHILKTDDVVANRQRALEILSYGIAAERSVDYLRDARTSRQDPVEDQLVRRILERAYPDQD